MTVSTTSGRVAYTGNGSTQNFAVTFEFNVAADLKVYQNGTLKTLTTHYTVSGGSGSTGTVSFLTAPADGVDIVILDDPAVTQTTDYTPNDPFPAESHERALDKLTRLARRLKDRLDRAFTLADSDTSGASVTLPSPTSLGVIGWNLAADALVNYDAQSLTGSIASIDWLVDQFSGTGAQTVFILTRDPGVAANCDVSISGVTQVPGVDFTVSGTTLTFTTAPVSGTNNICVRYGSAMPSGGSVGVDGVATASIQDNAVTSAKIADGAVTSAKLASGFTLSVANGGTGATSLTANNVLLGNGTSALQAVAPGSSGNVLTSNGTTWASSAVQFPVTSVNGQTGAVTISTSPTTSDVLTALKDLTYGAVGTFAFLRQDAAINPGSTYSGSSLYYSSYALGESATMPLGSSPSGTWRALGYSNSTDYSATLFIRIS